MRVWGCEGVRLTVLVGQGTVGVVARIQGNNLLSHVHRLCTASTGQGRGGGGGSRDRDTTYVHVHTNVNTLVPFLSRSASMAYESHPCRSVSYSDLSVSFSDSLGTRRLHIGRIPPV